jgi:CRISPR-associated protein Cas2
MRNRVLHIVAYDVRDPRRLRRVLDVVKAYSTGGQKSVHECYLTSAERATLDKALAAEIREAEDSVVIVRLDPRCGVRTLGIAEAPRDPAFFYLG